MIETLEQLVARRSELNQMVADFEKEIELCDGKNLVHRALVPLFEKYDNITSIEFTAFTPSFNDGDPCTFNSYHSYPDVNGVAYNSKAHNEVKAFLNQLTDDDILTIFGEDIKVIITKDGIEIEDYNDY